MALTNFNQGAWILAQRMRSLDADKESWKQGVCGQGGARAELEALPPSSRPRIGPSPGTQSTACRPAEGVRPGQPTPSCHARTLPAHLSDPRPPPGAAWRKTSATWRPSSACWSCPPIGPAPTARARAPAPAPPGPPSTQVGGRRRKAGREGGIQVAPRPRTWAAGPLASAPAACQVTPFLHTSPARAMLRFARPAPPPPRPPQGSILRCPHVLATLGASPLCRRLHLHALRGRAPRAGSARVQGGHNAGLGAVGGRHAGMVPA